ncbi:MAG: hypothetical protein AAF975_06015 [Spirochaetota bacterium]
MRKAVRLLIRGQLTRCIQLLEPKISLFIEDADYFYLLGRCYFTAGDSENAKLYLERGLASDPDHEEIQLMLACFAVRQRDTYQAISIWLKLENAGCHRTCLRYGLDQIRRLNDSEELYNFAHGPRFMRLFPILPGALAYRVGRGVRRLSLLVLVLGLGWWGYRVLYPSARDWYVEWQRQRVPPMDISLAELDSSEILAFEQKDALFSFSESELKNLADAIRKNYDLYYDNLVQRDINKVLYSNASDAVKVKFQLVESLLGRQQEIHNLKHNFRFPLVRKMPQVYQNCLVKWEGTATNIRMDTEGNLWFTLLVGYTDKRVLEGQVSVRMTDLIAVPLDAPITVFAKVQLFDWEAARREQVTAEAAGLEELELGTEPFYLNAKTLAYS